MMHPRQETKKRIQLLDGARGLAVVLMVIHHLLYDFCAFLGLSWVWFTNPVLDVLHYIFAGLFVFLCGISSRFSHSNLKRGWKTALCALGITAVTVFMRMDILFGVLHLLAFCMLFYGLVQKWEQRLPDAAALPLYLALLVGSAVATGIFNPVGVRWLFPLGFYARGFSSADYFPIFPWLFVFLLGTRAGRYIKEGKMPERFYTARVPFFPVPGRHALLIYLIHQPILYGITLLLGALMGK